jgi:outer membrane protein assembly factor BamB
MVQIGDDLSDKTTAIVRAGRILVLIMGNVMSRFCLPLFFAFVACCGSAMGQQSQREQLWAAVRSGDVAEVTRLLDEGASVNEPNEIGVTALWIAAGKGKPEIVQLLVDRGADVNVRDLIWYQTPLSTAIRGTSEEIVDCLLNAGAADIEDAAKAMAGMGNVSRLKLMLETGPVGQEVLDAMLYSTSEKTPKVRELLIEAGAKPLPSAAAADRQRWASLAGKYEHDMGGGIELAVEEVGLVIKSSQGGTPLRETGPDQFVPIGSKTSSLLVERSGDAVQRIIFRRYTSELLLYPAKEIATAASGPDLSMEEDSVAGSDPVIEWPQFRGPNATGIGEGQHPPLTWDVKTGENVQWKTAIPGLGHSCPVISGGRVFLTTAVSGDPDPEIRIGNYGDVGSVDDTTEHTWHVLCLDSDSGAILWNREVHKGVPKIKRHLKGSQANCTPATDGKHVVACFGSEGLYCFDFEGDLLWSRDLSAIDSSFALDEEYEWGFASSPVIHEGLVIVQFDLSRDSFLAAYSLADGNKVWETPRDEIPSWSSPAIWRNSQRTELVTNASQYARSYDPATGKELWRLAKKSEATIPAPVPWGDWLVICSGNRPIQPIFAIRPGAEGDISLKDKETSNEFIAWSQMRGGPYMPTPIVCEGYLHVCSNTGVLTCIEMETGRQVYRERLGGGSYTSSPVAADGRIYFTAENGEVRVVKAGPDFELLAENGIGEICMAVPALSGGKLFIRSQHHLFALKRGAHLPPSESPADALPTEGDGD